MTNLEAWRLLNRENPSPANFIDVAFFYMISAALERRVWQGAIDRKALFFNLYVVLVATPGIGKSWVLDCVKLILEEMIKEPEQSLRRTPPRSIPASDIGEALLQQNHIVEPEYMLNFSADATTYEALITTLAKTSDWIITPDGKTYFYASMCAILDEFTSIFNKDAGLTKDFLLSMYGCGNYKKDTQKHGRQEIRNPCFSLIAGTTPKRISEIKEIDIMDDGFSARTMFIYAEANRFIPPFNIPPYSEEQISARNQIVAHLKKLKARFGQVEFAPDALAWLEDDKNTRRINYSDKLQYYYVRRTIHIKKMAGLVELSENPSASVISLTASKIAVALLNRWEILMHRAFDGQGLNLLAPTAVRIENACARKPMQDGEILELVYNDLTGPQLDVMLSDMVRQGRLRLNPDGKYENVKRPDKQQVSGNIPQLVKA